MDKNKNRTDLLAAGRKRLQQFRQQKDGKGSSSHGKSSKKSGKPQQHESVANAATSASMSAASSRSTDENVETGIDSNLVITESSETESLANSLTPDHHDQSVDTGVKTESDSNTELALQVQGVGESDSELSVPRQGESAQDVGADVAKDVFVRTPDSLGYEGGATYDHMSAPVDILSSPESVSAAEGESVIVEREGEKREESLLLFEDIPNTSLMQTREDQEADGLDMNKSCRISDAAIDGQKKLPLFEVGESDQSLSGIAIKEIRNKEASHEVEQLGKPVEVLSSFEAIGSDKFSASDKGREDDIATAGPFSRNLDRETLPDSSYAEVILQPSQEQISKEVLSGEGRGINRQYTPVGSVVVDQIHELSMRAHEVNSTKPLGVSSISDASPINLLWLAEIIRGLNEEGYRFLLKSREAVSDADNDFSETFQRLQEQFFLANLMTNIFNLQLAEQLEIQLESDNQHYQLIDELSQLQASHNEVNEKNQCLLEELANCRVELHDVSSKSVELQNQFNTAKAEVEELSARVLEMQISFEMSQKDSLDLSTELADCRGLVSGLQSENKDVNETLALVIKEKNKLVEEKEFHLYESKKLENELANFKSSMEGVKGENSNLKERLSLVTEERNKIRAEIEHLSHELDRLSIDLVESKDLVASLQEENTKLNGSLALSADKIEELEEDKQEVVVQNQRLSSQIVALQEQLSIEKGEQMRCEVDLEEVRMSLEQLTKENIFLNSTLDVHKVKIEETDNKHSQLLSQHGNLGNQAQVARGQIEGLEIPSTEDSLHNVRKPDEEGSPKGPPLYLLEQEVFDDSLGFVSLKMPLDEVENILVKLEKAINVLHSQSVSFGRSSEKVSSPAVSKLIQAFESKSNQDKHEVEGRDSGEVQPHSDSFLLTKEQIGKLRTLLTKWRLDVENAGTLFKGERDGRKIGDAKYNELKDQFEALRQHCSNLEVSNIELELHCEALKKEDIHLESKNNEIYEKLGSCLSKIRELHVEMYDVKRRSNEMDSEIGSELENFQKEVTERVMLLEQGWNTTIAEMVEVVGKLDQSTGETLSSTISTGDHDGLDISHRLAVSVNAATEVILDLRKKLEATYSEQEIICTSFSELNTKYDDLLGKNELAVDVLRKMYSDLSKLVFSHTGSMEEDKTDVQSETFPDLLDYKSFHTIMKYLGDILNEKLELESITKEMKSELMQRKAELEELNMRCFGLDFVSKLIEDVEDVLNMEDMRIEMNKTPLSSLESLVSRLVQKIREAEIQLHIAKECYESRETEWAELQEKMQYLDTLHLEHENEILILKESLSQAEESLSAACSELHQKSNELEQSEQRVSSIREKLSIAVAKGKGLIVQRDGLKQSLVETSSELERCLQELQFKDTRLHEVETKLKTYAEAGERVEALESELSYIRNSANALRESFLLKDSMLQRIEEILEDLDLPDQFHFGDIIEKIEWLARSVSVNSLSMNDCDQKDSAGGGSYSDAGYVVTDSSKDDSKLPPDSGDDFIKTFEELQSKYYLLAEQNEMLEQSLMERNILVQRWAKLVDMIDMPSHLHSMEMEDRIVWLGRALVEANHLIDSLQLKIEKYDSYCGLLDADLVESKRRVSALHADLRAVTSDREHLSERMEVLKHEYEKISVQTMQAKLENEKLHNEIATLKEKLEQKAAIEEQIFTIDGKIRKLQDLVCEALSESETENLVSCGESIDSLENLLRKLIENHATLSSKKPAYGDSLDGHCTQKDDATLHETRSADIYDTKEPDIDSYKKDLEEALCELMHVKEERDRNLEKQISVCSEVEALSKRNEELQELLNQEEQKSASIREKLNVAVRKGKSLVQQRDSLKQTIEEMSIEIEHLKSEISNRESALAEHAEKFRELSTFPDRFEALESESLLLKNRLGETEHQLQEREYTLKVILNKLGEIEVGGEGNTSDPVKKLEWVCKLCSDLHGAVASLEQESRKSKRASELLLAELNEVQERNDAFQEELAKVTAELVDLRKERDSAEIAKLEALSHLEKLSALHVEGKKSQFSEIMGLKSSVNQLFKGFCEVGKLLASAFFMDLESFQNLEAGLESCLKGNNAADVVDSSATGEHDGFFCRSSDTKKSSLSEDLWSDVDTTDQFDDNTIVEICHLLRHQLQEFFLDVSSLKGSIHKHSSLAQEQGKTLSKLMVTVQREMTSQRESCETMKKEISEKDGELAALRGNIAYLYEACTNSVIVIEKGKAELVGKVASSDLGINLKGASFDDGVLPFSSQFQLISEECIKTMADRLLLAAKEVASIKTEVLDANQKEMKATITNLQRELQEKDVQRDRICMELVNRIKDAEAAANNYSLDIQSSRIQEQNLEKQVEEIEAERKILEHRMNELLDIQGTAAELEEKITSQTDLLAAKDQEIESLMHALDEEEMQMEELTKKMEELEKFVQQKNQEIENLEASRGKVMKKLSITVSKFDELHHLSASLLAEVEKLQSQLQEKDTEISFLRQEVTRCTNDVLLASQMSNNRSSDEIFEFLMWVDTIVSREGMHVMHPDVKSNSQVHEYKEILRKKLVSLLSELENLRAVAESKDAMLQVERSKVDELTHRAETLEMLLHEEESQLNLLEGVEETGRGASTSSEILEVEPEMNKWTAAGTSVTPLVRSLRKGNSDHIAIALDEDPGTSSRIKDEEDDKVHGFKSLSSSKKVPRFTRPLTDMIDGLWVSCDRALMRQPVLRLGIIIYWTMMHALLAFFVV